MRRTTAISSSYCPCSLVSTKWNLEVIVGTGLFGSTHQLGFYLLLAVLRSTYFGAGWGSHCSDAYIPLKIKLFQDGQLFALWGAEDHSRPWV
ncbi:hypothetical protein BDW75DRAFT_203588 [Aspergillus navahoensis]